MIGQNFSLNNTVSHSLTQRLADNIRSSHLQVSRDVIEVYFQNLSEALERIPETNIFNFDETNVTDDPSRKKCIVQRGLARIAEHSKQSVSIMFSGNAVGQYWFTRQKMYKKGGWLGAQKGLFMILHHPDGLI